MAAKPKAEAAPTDAAETPKKKGKLVLIISLAVVLLGAGGGGAWYFLKGDGEEKVVEEKAKPAVFLPLESFTVNLQPSEGQPQYIQAGLTLKLEDNETSELVKSRMPEVRNKILMVLSAKKGNELLPVTGKQKLAEEIAQAVTTVVTPEPPKKAAPKKKKDEAENEDEKSEKSEKTAKADKADKAEKSDDEDEDEKPKKAKNKAPAVKIAKVEVLFTAFIIQ